MPRLFFRQLASVPRALRGWSKTFATASSLGCRQAAPVVVHQRCRLCSMSYPLQPQSKLGPNPVPCQCPARIMLGFNSTRMSFVEYEPPRTSPLHPSRIPSLETGLYDVRERRNESRGANLKRSLPSSFSLHAKPCEKAWVGNFLVWLPLRDHLLLIKWKLSPSLPRAQSALKALKLRVALESKRRKTALSSLKVLLLSMKERMLHKEGSSPQQGKARAMPAMPAASLMLWMPWGVLSVLSEPFARKFFVSRSSAQISA